MVIYTIADFNALWEYNSVLIITAIWVPSNPNSYKFQFHFFVLIPANKKNDFQLKCLILQVCKQQTNASPKKHMSIFAVLCCFFNKHRLCFKKIV